MQEPLVVSFHGLQPSAAIEARVREKVRKLERIHHNITAGRVAVELPNQKHTKGNLFQIRIDLEVAGKLLVVDKVAGKNPAHEDVFIAIRDAFDAMRRQLQDYMQVRRGDVKLHEEGPSYGRVTSLFPDEGYGFITSPDGRELYFHANSVLNDGFNKLELGFEVRYAEEEGEKGPQASTVAVAGKQRGGASARQNGLAEEDESFNFEAASSYDQEA